MRRAIWAKKITKVLWVFLRILTIWLNLKDQANQKIIQAGIHQHQRKMISKILMSLEIHKLWVSIEVIQRIINWNWTLLMMRRRMMTSMMLKVMKLLCNIFNRRFKSKMKHKQCKRLVMKLIKNTELFFQLWSLLIRKLVFGKLLRMQLVKI